jgi:putative peptidoglycan lipid II flippase
LQENVYQPASGWWLFFIRVLLASVAMSSALYYQVDASWWNQWSSGERVINLLKWIVIGIFIYTVTLMLTGLRLRHLSVAQGKGENKTIRVT